MIRQFSDNTALVVIDVQEGVNNLQHWGGRTGRRNNVAAERNIAAILDAWRQRALPVYFTAHDSLELTSPLRLSVDSGRFMKGFEPAPGETVIEKHANSAFVGTNLEFSLTRRRIHRLLFVGFFTNICVETSVRMANNLGYETYLAHDACATTNRFGHDGTDYDPETIHALSLANQIGEFATGLTAENACVLTRADAPALERRQGNEYPGGGNAHA